MPDSTASIPPLIFKILPPSAFSFALPFFLLAVLLQPAIPPYYSRPLRLALAFPAAYGAYNAPFKHRHEPAEFAIAANFRWGIFGPAAVLLALTWSLMSESDRKTELAWVGFDGERTEQVHGGKPVIESVQTEVAVATTNQAVEVVAPKPIRPREKPTVVVPAMNEQLPTPSPSPPFEAVNPPSLSSAAPPPANLPALSASSSAALGTEQREHPLRILGGAMHLLSSIRGIGYVFGPPTKYLPDPPKSERALVLGAMRSFATASAVSTACIALQVLDRDGVLPTFLTAAVPFLPPRGAVFLSSLAARICIGLSLWVQMKIGFSGLTLGFFLLHHIINFVLDHLSVAQHVQWRSTFDVREYPPLFNHPFSMMGEGGVAAFWSKRWHFLFRAVFTGTIYNPATRLAKRLGVPKRIGALLGAVLVFAGSAWMHWQALVSARTDIGPTAGGLAFLSSQAIPASSAYSTSWSDLSFIERHGTWIFFLSQPLAIVFEQLFTLVTRRRVRSWPGKLWTIAWIVVLGEAVVGRSWLALGLVHGLPPVDRWSWERWIMPTFEMAPMPAFMRTV
ncbi:hypothetical protein JCM10908_003416 [Rhodotorula pacifica]|uniref:wax synthase family protein n=1 Tax=Rhodotorula pacifica TaxID=1495444 RepID=UPI00317ECB60